MVVGGSKLKTLNKHFVLFDNRQQGVLVILRELMFPTGLDPVSSSFTKTTLPSDRLQLLFERQLKFLVKFRTQLRNHPRFGDTMEVDGLISQLRTELENHCSFHESSTNCNFNETAVFQDPLSGPVLFISETCPVLDSNPIIPETACANSDLSSSQKEDALLNVHEIVAVTAHEETENKLSNAMNAVAPNGAHHSVIEVSDESNYRDPFCFTRKYVRCIKR
ncbi:unnamed protein product [Schistosoma margrebowiei]|uniref:Uncharacterized protein n=1 Tax=Schistosoma margrebowiei TaxID=48269 RepID=A0A183LIX3_9TREM|nr:unnamed protein product [Schistosoma margrebowiei]